MKWVVPETNIAVDADVLAELLRLRGVNDISSFLHPDITQLHQPGLLFDSASAAETILDAVKAGDKIFIHGDYDVDGVCATGLLWDFLYHQLKADVLPFIPNRFDDGYGLSSSSLDQIISQGAKLIITVDCGVKDIEKVQEYADKGIKFVITDHHALPVDDAGQAFVSNAAVAVVHPRYPKHEYPFVEICGTTVAWKLCQVIAQRAKLDIDMFSYLDLVALATVCDVMPLTDENRSLVALGLERLQTTERLGLNTLMRVADVKKSELKAYQLGFALGPRLNAAGRLESAMDALRLLTTSTLSQAEQLATKLQTLNSERQRLTQNLLAEAEAMISKLPADQKVFFIYGEKWPEGIVGLIAGKLTEKYSRPVLVASSDGKGIKGSARSIASFHIADAFKQLSPWLERHGGHALAAGFTLKQKKLPEFTQELFKLADKIPTDDLQPQLNIDLVVPTEAVTLTLAENLANLEPFGFGNSTPVFMLSDLEITNYRRFGKNSEHANWQFTADQKTLSGVQFRAATTAETFHVGDRVDVAANISLDTWNGRRSVRLTIKDIRPHE